MHLSIADMDFRRWRKYILPAAAALIFASALFYVLAPGLQPWNFPAPAPAPQECHLDPSGLPPSPPAADGQPTNFLHTCGGRLFDSHGNEVQVTGVNWFGLETGTFAPHGLWTRNWHEMLDQIAVLGYNTIRLPFSDEALKPGQIPSGINYHANPDLQGLTAIEVLDRIVQGARERGLRIVLDRHRPDSQGQSPLWYTETVGEEQWLANWRALVNRYKSDDTVIGVDLHNEPRGAATWGSGDPATDWRLAAERAGNAVLAENPYLLVLVEGIEQYNGDWYWWGGNLQGVAKHPVRLDIPNRLVYSAHDYGPGVYQQGWFADPSFPANLPKVWDQHWGYIQREGIAPVILGEFGGESVGSDAEGQWQRALVSYLKARQISYFAWSLNPNSGDTGGLLSEDWLTVVAGKQVLYSSYLAPPILSVAGEHFGPPAQHVELLYKNNSPDDRTNTIDFSIQLFVDGAKPVDLSRLEIRYWFSSGDLRGTEQIAEVDWAAAGADSVHTDLVATTRGNQDHYLRITFTPKAGQVAAYSYSGEVLLRLHKSDWSTYVQSNDYSFGQTSASQQWDRITVYLDGQLLWGREP